MLDTKYRCQTLLPMFRHEAIETLKGLKFYLETLEWFIDRERTQEISELKKHIEQWSPEQQEDFWAWHYPVHWDEIFASQLRSSFVPTLISLTESHIGMIADQACEILTTSIKPRDLRGGLFEQHRKYLEAMAGFTRPSDATWNSLYEIRDVRNCVVHANSRIYDSRNQERLRSLVRKLPGLSASYDVLELSPEFLLHGLKVIEGFITDLYEEASALCQRVSKERNDS